MRVRLPEAVTAGSVESESSSFIKAMLKPFLSLLRAIYHLKGNDKATCQESKADLWSVPGTRSGSERFQTSLGFAWH